MESLLALMKLNASVTPNNILIEKVELHEEDKTREIVLFVWAFIYSPGETPELILGVLRSLC